MQSKSLFFFPFSLSLKREIEKSCWIYWARFYFCSSASPLTSDLLLTGSSVSTDSSIHLRALPLLKSVFPVFHAPSQFSLPLVAVETHTSPSSSIQNGSIPFSPDFPFPQCFLLLIHASPVPQAMVCTCNILLCIRQQGSQQVLVPIIMCLECR